VNEGDTPQATYLLTQRFVTIRQEDKLIPNMGNRTSRIS